ncbi:hypothetical protein [Streptomyces sp. DH8]|uniref:hypothetical protein n=1 Tax=Streptomyces sp. DH8 TaxID=2857008 RepID=UPI001E54692E|nr:hypothetical protein [Streptomyces sp. DH8]
MPKTTDQNAPGAKTLDESTVAVLVAVAEHFRTVRPTEPLECTDLLVCVGAEAYNAVGRRLDGSSARLAEAALAAMPRTFGGITRGETVLRIRAAVLAAGHDWTDGDNDPAIPRIPSPRIPAKVPRQPGPDQSAAPICCGRTMRHDGTQWVCPKCKGWTDTGRTALTLVPSPAGEVAL